MTFSIYNDANLIDLATLYANTTRLKNGVYRRWMDNLTIHAQDTSHPAKQQEALRRIDYIDRELLNREWQHDRGRQ